MAKTATRKPVAPLPKPKLTWKNPPAAALRARSRFEYEAVLDAVHAEPGRWALVATATDVDSATRLRTALRTRARLGKVPGDASLWMFVSHECEVFARYRDAGTPE